MKKNFFKSKAFRITLISLLSVGILTGGGIYLARRNRTSKAVDVYPVNSISQQNWEQFGTYGSVMPGSSDTYRKSSAVVKEVYVQLGDEVEEGTPLFAYDTTSVEIAKNKAYTAWQLALLDVEDAKKQLEIYKTYTPYVPIEPVIQQTVQVIEAPEEGQKEDLQGSGTKEDPYVFDIDLNTKIDTVYFAGKFGCEITYPVVSSPESVTESGSPDTSSASEVSDVSDTSDISEISESSSNEVTESESSSSEEIPSTTPKPEPICTRGEYIKFRIWNHNNYEADSKLICTWLIKWDPEGENSLEQMCLDFNKVFYPDTINPYRNLSDIFKIIEYDESGKVRHIETIKEINSFSEIIINTEPVQIFPEEIPESKSYSQKEIDQMIADQSRKITTLDIAARQAELDYKKANAAAVDGVVKSTCPGIISTLNDYDTLEANGVFMTVQSNAGLIVQGTIDELDLDVISPGMSVNVMDMRTGMGYEAVVKEISPVPQRYGDMMQSVNPNSSFYSFKAELVDTTAEIEVYSYVQMMFDSSSDNDAFYIPVQFVRKENGSNYVMMMDENGLLKKQFIKTGATLYGYLVEVKGGLTEDDYIAFPYGKTVNEGAKCNTDADMSALYGY